jgi:hypothetical protein
VNAEYHGAGGALWRAAAAELRLVCENADKKK